MENEVVIDVQNVEKSFRVYKDKGYTLKSKILFSNRRAYEDRKVLRGISFQVRRGEAIGLIGHNGCGKSTTLKLLSRIIYPDKGKITMKGRVSSLIELGAGFHPDMTGRENIYINASIFGLNREEIDRRLGEIIDFSELGEFIDTPVRTYSSGMYMRLAFSVAINVDADILLIDEILAVGDAAFQAKCFNKLRDIKCNGTTIVIVSHSLGQIEQICERSYWIDKGLIRMEGAPRDVHPHYIQYMGTKDYLDAPMNTTEATTEQQETTEVQTDVQTHPEDNDGSMPSPDAKRWGDGRARIENVKLIGESGKDQSVFRSGEPLLIAMKYHTKSGVLKAVPGIAIYRTDNVHVYGTNTLIDRIPEVKLHSEGTVTLKIQSLNLAPGEYKFDFALNSDAVLSYDYWRDARTIRVYSDCSEVGITHLHREWEFSE